MSEYEDLIKAFEEIHGLRPGDLVVQDEVLESRAEGSSPNLTVGMTGGQEGRGWGESPIMAQGERPYGSGSAGHLPALTSSRLERTREDPPRAIAEAAAGYRRDRTIEELVSRYGNGVNPYHGGPPRGALLTAETVGEPTQGERGIKEESRINLGVGAQWRPTSEKKEELMVQALERLVSRLDSMSASGRGEPELEFSGRPSEDPGRFMQDLEGWLVRNQVPEGRWRTVTRRCLKGSAYSWFEGVQDQEWSIIKALFEQHWDSVAVRGRLWRQLFGETQKPNESVAAFTMAKWGLFRRLAPELPEGEKLDIIKELLHPEVRAYIRGGRTQTLQDLLELGSQVERDLQEIRRPQRQPEVGRRAEEPRRPVGPPARAPPARTPQAGPGRDPYPCRWCGSRGHWDNRCPTRNITRNQGPPPPQQTAGPSGREAQQGNGPRATAAAPERQQ